MAFSPLRVVLVFRRFMNSPTEGNGIRDTVSAANLVSQVQFNGLVRHVSFRISFFHSKPAGGLSAARLCFLSADCTPLQSHFTCPSPRPPLCVGSWAGSRRQRSPTCPCAAFDVL